MPITLTAPESRPSSTEARLVSIAVNLPTRTVTLQIRVGEPDGESHRVVTRVFADVPEDDRTEFTDLLAAVPEVRQLRRALEQYLVALGDFTGIVS